MATDEVYFATENGQILDVDYHHMQVFRKSTLFSLLQQVPSTIGRMARPNNIVERHRNRSYSMAGRSGMRAEGSVNDGSMDDAAERDRRFKRRGTVNLVKNFMVSKIQRAQQSGFVDGNSMQDGTSMNANMGIGLRLNQQNRINNLSMAPGGVRDQSSLGGRGNNMSPGNMTSAAAN